MIDMPPIEHHQKVIKELNEMTKQEIVSSLPKMKDISVLKIRDSGNHIYDVTKLKGEILLRVVCSDGIVLVIKEF